MFVSTSGSVSNSIIGTVNRDDLSIMHSEGGNNDGVSNGRYMMAKSTSCLRQGSSGLFEEDRMQIVEAFDIVRGRIIRILLCCLHTGLL